MKRYTTEQQILDKIDSEKKRAVSFLGQAESLEQSARELFKIPEMVEDAKYKMSNAKKLRKQSARIIDKKLKELGAKLSELRTMPCIALDGTKGIGDESVSAS